MTDHPVVTLRFRGLPPFPPPPLRRERASSFTSGTGSASHADPVASESVASNDPLSQSGSGSGGGGLFSRLSRRVSGIRQGVMNTAHRTVLDISNSSDANKFATLFSSEVNKGAGISSAHRCAVISGGATVKGTLFVTTISMGFASEDGSLRDLVPFPDFASYLPSLDWPVADGPRVISGIPAPCVKPSALQVFTTKQQLFQFVEFEEGVLETAAHGATFGNSLSRAIASLDSCWRAYIVATARRPPAEPSSIYGVVRTDIQYCAPHY